jgi:hypothetical protein
MELPQPSDIQNVFALNKPQHMLSKLLWELDSLSKSLSVWTKKTEFPEPLFVAWNAVVTAWHITDWLWQSTPEIRKILTKRYALKFVEGSKNAVRDGLEEFQNAVASDSRPDENCDPGSHRLKPKFHFFLQPRLATGPQA